MNPRIIYITDADMRRLQPLVESNKKTRDDLHKLGAELANARVVSHKEVPADVITMNSKARLRDLETNEDLIYTLVFPDQANIEQGRISVVAPIGTAMLGYRVGDEFQWEVPGGTVRMKVEEILYQPEAAGDYHL